MALLINLGGRGEGSWIEGFRAALPGYRVLGSGDAHDPADIRYYFGFRPGRNDFDGMSGLKAVLSLGAGVDGLLRHPALPDVPVVRFIDDELNQCMADYVLAQVSRHQRLETRFRRDQAARRWVQLYPPPASTISVGVMGLGVIGGFVIERLKGLGYGLNGWSRSARSIEGVTTFHGNDQLDAFLGATDILVNLLPLTTETEGILNRDTFGKLRRGPLDGGPVVVNAGRGKHQREADLVAALTDGTLGAASLDVFEIEPLPPNSPLWALDNCYITPHIAAVSNERTGVAYFARIIRDHEAGKPLINVVDRARGY